MYQNGVSTHVNYFNKSSEELYKAKVYYYHHFTDQETEASQKVE